MLVSLKLGGVWSRGQGARGLLEIPAFTSGIYRKYPINHLLLTLCIGKYVSLINALHGVGNLYKVVQLPRPNK